MVSVPSLGHRQTYEPIASQTLTTSASEIIFSSIPGIYTDLVLVVSSMRTSGGYIHQVQFNSDSGSNYSSTVLNGGVSGSTALSTRYTSGTFLYATYGVGGTTTNPDALTIQIMSYANTNIFKTTLVSAASVGSGSVERIVGLWRSTNAITSIRIWPTSGAPNYASGSTFSLYGIRAAS